jgi:tetratricopeptide (TPR) repeat protein
VEGIALHLATCPACRTLTLGTLGDKAAAARRAALLKATAEVAAFEKAKALDRLLAKAALAEIRRLKRGAQKGRVILSRFCHSPAFLDALLDSLCSPRSREESESLANLAVLAVRGVDPAEGSEIFKNDRLAMIWIEAANARRVRGEWQQARAALLRGKEHRVQGSGNLLIRARWLSIAGSLECDQAGHEGALASLEESRQAYALAEDWLNVGRTLAIMANCTADDEPERALAFLNRANAYLSLADASLRSLVERIRTECLIALGRIEEALQAFAEAERLRPLHDRPAAALRSGFVAARLLEAVGHLQEAEMLFDAIVSEELERGHFKDAGLDLVYLFEFHLRLGSPERAADAGVRALDELTRRQGPGNEACRSVLAGLIDAARGQALDEEMLRDAREYLRAEWNRSQPPEPRPPTISGERSSAHPQRRAITAPDRALVEPIRARALWSRLRRETRREQHAQVTGSSEYHTAAFVELLLADLRRTPAREETEFLANLALQAIPHVDVTLSLKHDLQAQIWTEVANARRFASEWKKAGAALGQVAKHLTEGSGDPLLQARERSVSASLLADQGRRGEALAALEECLGIYEKQGAWLLVARTLVQTAHILVDTEPMRALTLVGEALPFMSAADATLWCLAANIRVEAMIELGEIDLALQTFHQAAPLRNEAASPAARRRGDFSAARLLERLGHAKEAVQLFEAVIADGFDGEAYREAFLDLLYLFGVHIRQGATDRAAAICRLAIERLDLFGLGHEQMRTVWQELGDAALRRVICLECLPEVRQFLKSSWTTPAPTIPRLTSR